MIARHLAQSQVVKAFNAILAADLENTGTPGRRALPIAADDADAKATVAALQDQFGFDVVDAGPLSDSWRFERGKPGYCLPLDIARIIHEKCAVKAKPLISFTTMRMGCLMKFFAMKSLAQVFGGLGRFRAVR